MKNFNFVLLGIILIIVLSGCTTTDNFKSSASAVPQKTCRDVQVPYEAQEEYLKTEYYTETVPYTDRECEEKDFAYRVSNVDIDWNNGLFDSNKDTVEVRFDITNLENEKGLFRYQTMFMVNDQYKFGCHAGSNQWDAANRPYNNNPIDSSYSGFSRQILAQATENVYCGFDKSSSSGDVVTYKEWAEVIPPKKQICRDVTKYKEVKRERQVTAYRPVTKYRTEQRCD